MYKVENITKTVQEDQQTCNLPGFYMDMMCHIIFVDKSSDEMDSKQSE